MIDHISGIHSNLAGENHAVAPHLPPSSSVGAQHAQMLTHEHIHYFLFLTLAAFDMSDYYLSCQ